MESNGNPPYASQQPTDFLAAESDLLQIEYSYATQGQRFLNFLIDNLLLRFGLSYVTGTAVGYLLGVIAPDFVLRIAMSESSINWDLILLSVLIGYVNYIIYYTICEKLFKGLTLGKLITGTRAIRQDGGELSFKDALLRSLVRCVPFEVFSGFNTLTWHDSWTKTMVVRTR
jgi:uncharacterized RDD family membrane protein YckC